MLQFSSDKRGEILAAAMTVFATYGFRKTSMDDIAKASGVSRPALYHLFKNKTDIFRGLSLELLANAERAAANEFAADAPFRERLHNAIDRSLLEIHRIMAQSPHGQELIDVSEEIADDIDKQWKDRLGAVLSAALKQAANKGEIKLTALNADQTARLFFFAMEGIHHRYGSGSEINNEVEKLIHFFSSTLTE